MKKDRNSFFESNFNMSSMGPMNLNPNMGMPAMQSSAQSNFTAYQNMPMPMPNYPNSGNMTELESRLSKLERSINRLDARLSKLEGNMYTSTTNYEADGNMYIV